MTHSKLNEQVDQFFEKYSDHMEFFKTQSHVAKTRGVNNEDLYALGMQLENYEDFQAFAETNGSLGDLGVLPNIALDVITASAAQSPVALMASIQPLQEQQGTIYFKNLIAETSRGNVTAGDTLTNVQNGRVTRPQGFAGEQVVAEANGTTDGAVTNFTGTVTYFPAVKRTVEVTVDVDATIKLIDDGKGNLIGLGGSGTIDYVTGDFDIDFLVAPAAGNVLIGYDTNFEALTEIPTIRSEFDSMSVKARPFALRSDVGLFKSFTLGKRFGINVEESMAKDLTQELTTEVASAVVAEAVNNCLGNTNWDKEIPGGASYSYTEHKLTFFDALADAEAVILGQAGRSGGATTLIAGHKASSIIRTLPGFKPAGDLNAILGTHFYGTLDGKPVLRSSVVATAEVIMVSKGSSMFDTSLVYAPYMPLFITGMADGIDHNPLKSQKGVALMAGMAAPVPTLMTKITIVNP